MGLCVKLRSLSGVNTYRICKMRSLSSSFNIHTFLKIGIWVLYLKNRRVTLSFLFIYQGCRKTRLFPTQPESVQPASRERSSSSPSTLHWRAFLPSAAFLMKMLLMGGGGGGEFHLWKQEENQSGCYLFQPLRSKHFHFHRLESGVQVKALSTRLPNPKNFLKW